MNIEKYNQIVQHEEKCMSPCEESGALESKNTSNAINIDIESQALSLARNPKGSHVKLNSECSICLADYIIGDKITYSANEQCTHTYHKDCLIQWLVKGHNSCPTCRNEFIKCDINDDSMVKLSSR